MMIETKTKILHTNICICTGVKVRLVYSYCNFSPKLKTLTPNIRYFKDTSKINGRY